MKTGKILKKGKTLFLLYDITGKEKYRKAIDVIYGQLKGQPRTSEGNFWHKKIYPNQVWLDGIYMGAPFYAEYAFRNNQVKDYAGKRVLITSGPNHEPMDPVRFIGNRSSGKQGHAIARALHNAGAEVTLITGPVALPDPAGIKTIHIETADQMKAAAEADGDIATSGGVDGWADEAQQRIWFLEATLGY